MRKTVIIAGTLALAALVAAPSGFEFAAPAAAQQAPWVQSAPQRPPNFLERLFGVRRPPPPPQLLYPAPPQVLRRAPPSTRRRSAPQREVQREEPREPQVEKDPDASAVLVVGDWVARNVADGLADLFGDERAVRIIDATDTRTGLVRDDVYDWPAQIGLVFHAQRNVEAIVVAIGGNDRQDLRLPEDRIAYESPEWDATYRARVKAFATALARPGKPVIWVGLPPFASASLREHALKMNGLYQTEAEELRIRYVDVWNGFADDNGNYTSFGPDLEGRNRRLRSSDGIGFTSAGKRKLAHFIERDIRLALGGRIRVALVPGSANRSVALGPAGTYVGPVISLTNPVLDPEATLVSFDAAREPDPLSPEYRLMVKGEPVHAPVGRADNFTWPPLRYLEPPTGAPPDETGRP